MVVSSAIVPAPISREFPSIEDVHLTGKVITLKGALIVKEQGIRKADNPARSVVDKLKVVLQLVSNTPGPDGKPKLSKPGQIEGWSFSSSLLFKDEVKYNISFQVDASFGTPGAVVVQNDHTIGIYFVSMSVRLSRTEKVHFIFNSWVYNSTQQQKHPNRVFFTNQLYLPRDTPPVLVPYRQADLKQLRGDGTGIRQHQERIYDYDVYNDLGKSDDPRAPLGGSKEMPYPRRCRTGRQKGPSGEELYPGGQWLKPTPTFYVPSEEYYSSSKAAAVLGQTGEAFSSFIIAAAQLGDVRFNSLEELHGLYDYGFDVSKFPAECVEKNMDLSTDKTNKQVIKFPVPAVIQNNHHAWRSDVEFARQLLAGTNPILISCLTEFPPSSTLGEAHKSTIAEKDISPFLKGMTVAEALERKKLFIVNLYDLLMPFIETVNSLPTVFMYATRTFLFLQEDGTLKPIAIELSTPNSSRVLVPPEQEGETDWLWELAKAHAAANDGGAHQLNGHWLYCHACIEPFIIAARRQLSALHPIFAFLKPHLRYTMQINALGRQTLINAGGVSEVGFTPEKYSMLVSSASYKTWSFASQGLPQDLIKRGMAVQDGSDLKLVIEDYPYAADGLQIWTALAKWTNAYVEVHYKDDASVQNDTELQAWWNEAVNIGHADRKDDETWYKMDSTFNLTIILTTFIWITTANHAAVNFSQYAYAGHIPSRPSATHLPVPERGSKEHRELLRNPEDYFLRTISTKQEAVVVMGAIERLSMHYEFEEYIGQRSVEINWTNNEEALEAFDKFAEDIEKVGELILTRNNDPSLKNRLGPAKVPFKQLYPTSSTKGITNQGVPNSVSI